MGGKPGLYRILGAPMSQCVPNYRGAARDEPYWVETMPLNADVNSLASWYATMYNNDADGYVHDVPTAFQLMAEYKKYGFEFEVVRFSYDNDVPRPREQSLGVDVVDKTDPRWSLLCSGLTFSDAVLSRELAHFQAALNANMLFGVWAEAQQFTELAIQQQQERHAFDPAAVYVPVGLFRLEHC